MNPNPDFAWREAETLSRLWLREPDLGGAQGAELAAAFADLFLLNVYPYGTVFTDPSGEMNGPSAAETARHYEACGYAPVELFRAGAPDHAGLCLGVLAYGEGMAERDNEFSFRLAEWLPVCCLAIEREPTAHAFYRALAVQTRKWIMAAMGEPEAEASARDLEPPPMSQPEEEVRLSDIVRFLLAPARCGIFLSRSKLGRIARSLGMRLPFASRFEVAQLLFETAGQAGSIEALIGALEAELVSWEGEYRAWAGEVPGWAGSAARWLLRIQSGRGMLTQMRRTVQSPPAVERIQA